MILATNNPIDSVDNPSIYLSRLDLRSLIPVFDPGGFQQVLLSTLPIAELRISGEPSTLSLDSLQSLVESAGVRYVVFSLAKHPWSYRFSTALCNLERGLGSIGVQLAVIPGHVCLNQAAIQDNSSPLGRFCKDWEREVLPSFSW